MNMRALHPESVIVCGNPRSGTSMMMRILEASGLVVHYDKGRQASTVHPRKDYECVYPMGPLYYMTEEPGCLKLVGHYLLRYKPVNCRFILMRRDLDETLDSYRKAFPLYETDRLRFWETLRLIENYLTRHECRYAVCDYNAAIEDPNAALVDVKRLIPELNLEAASTIITKALYRSRAKPLSLGEFS